MDNKTLINLDNNLMLKSENIEYDNNSLKNILDNFTNLLDNLAFEDVTSQFTFVNCTFNSGKIYKFGKLVFIAINITPTTTSNWGNIVQNIPNNLLPIIIYDNGQPITGSEFWVYGNTVKKIRGSITKNTVTTISGYYILQD